jgi:hypothetical protein
MAIDRYRSRKIDGPHTRSIISREFPRVIREIYGRLLTVEREPRREEINTWARIRCDTRPMSCTKRALERNMAEHSAPQIANR